jgi:AcrR family transcriptional regulator
MTPARPLRRDAAENREKVLDAASKVFAEHGLDGSVEEVARLAGVGMGTLYRRFSTKQALIDELVGGARRELLTLARTAEARSDGTGLEELLLAAGALQAEQVGCLSQVWNQSDAELEAMEEFRRIVAGLLQAAQAAGRVRSDVTRTDISLIFWSVRAIMDMTRGISPSAWRRHLELLISGLRPPSGRFTAQLGERAMSDSAARRITRAQLTR